MKDGAAANRDGAASIKLLLEEEDIRRLRVPAALSIQMSKTVRRNG